MRDWQINGVDVRHLLEEMYPLKRVRDNVLRLTLSAISEVNSFAPHAWGLTLWHDALRLNVGSTEGLTLSTNWIRAMLATDRSRADLSGLPIIATAYVGGSHPQCAFDGDVQNYFDNENLLHPLHFSYLMAAVTTKKGKPWGGSRHARGYERELWLALKELSDNVSSDNSDSPIVKKYFEGDSYSVQLDRYERNTLARAACLAHHGYDCAVCGMNFANFYGNIGHEYIQVHHLRVMSNGHRETDPVKDLIPVCANCHAMMHRMEPPVGIDELRVTVANQRKLRE